MARPFLLLRMNDERRPRGRAGRSVSPSVNDEAARLVPGLAVGARSAYMGCIEVSAE